MKEANVTDQIEVYLAGLLCKIPDKIREEIAGFSADPQLGVSLCIFGFGTNV